MRDGGSVSAEVFNTVNKDVYPCSCCCAILNFHLGYITFDQVLGVVNLTSVSLSHHANPGDLKLKLVAIALSFLFNSAGQSVLESAHSGYTSHRVVLRQRSKWEDTASHLEH